MTMYDMNLTTSHFPAQNDAEIRDITLDGLLREVTATHPDAVAMVDVEDSGDCGQSWTYGELLVQAERLARALATRFEADDRVVVWAPNIPEWIFMEYACGLAGLVLVTANPSFQAPELKYVLEQSGAVGLFMVDGFRGNPMAEIAREAT
jgi:fatty-acyl-CoA synthase